jgi:Rifampin ADP-ribosyl transferase
MTSKPIANLDDTIAQRFYHGNRAAVKPGGLIVPGYSSNYGKRKQASWVYLTGTLDAAIWGAELGRRRRPGKNLHRGADRSD